MGSKLALALIGTIWLLIATIPLVVRHREQSNIASVNRFKRSLSVLGRQCEILERADKIDLTLSLSVTRGQSNYAFVDADTRQIRISAKTLQRRRQVLFILAAGSVAPLLGYFALGIGSALYLSTIFAVLLGTYTATIAAVTRQQRLQLANTATVRRQIQSRTHTEAASSYALPVQLTR